jgi:hypothetical protein
MNPDRHARSPLGRRWLLNLVLIALLVALAVFLLYRHLTGPAAQTAALTALSAENLTRIRLTHQGRSPIVLIRDQDAAVVDGDPAAGWRMTEPVAGRVNPFNLKALFALAAAPIQAEVPFSAERLAAFGLAMPATEVRFDEETLTFGSTHPFNDQVYVRRGDHLFLIETRHYRVATYPYNSFLDTLLLGGVGSLSAIELPGFKLRLHEGGWRREPPHAQLTGDAINRFVEQWRHARALSVERTSGGRALKRVTLRFAEGPPLTLQVLAEQPEFVLYRADQGLAYHFPANVAGQLLQLAPERHR